MPKPNILTSLNAHVTSQDSPHEIMNWVNLHEGLSDNPLEIDGIPIDADTFKGHPIEHFASTTYVATTLSSYIASVLGTSY